MGNIRLATHRQIGYISEGVQAKKEESKKVVRTSAKSNDVDAKSESSKIFKWIDGNKKFFSIHALCKEVGIDTSNFNKLYKKNGEIPEQFIVPIKLILENYGYI